MNNKIIRIKGKLVRQRTKEIQDAVLLTNADLSTLKLGMSKGILKIEAGLKNQFFLK